MPTDIYKTIAEASSGPVFKDKKSKFYGYAYPVVNKGDIEEKLHVLRSEHPSARHLCYAWKIGIDKSEQRVNDDGEPHNSAGQPILGQIRAFGLTNVLVGVIRYYGGTKLGVGGLVNAYRTTARNAIELAKIIEKEKQQLFKLNCGYDKTGKVLHLIERNGWEILSRDMGKECKLIVGIRLGDLEKFRAYLGNSKNIHIEAMQIRSQKS